MAAAVYRELTTAKQGFEHFSPSNLRMCSTTLGWVRGPHFPMKLKRVETTTQVFQGGEKPGFKSQIFRTHPLASLPGLNADRKGLLNTN